MYKRQVWRFNPQALEAVYGKMNQNPLVLSRWTDTELSGSITADAAGVMYTSIPYDKGWSILVDGKPAAPRKMFDTFLAVDISEGTHRISFSYEPEGLKYGAWITGISAAVLGAAVLAGSQDFLSVCMPAERFHQTDRKSWSAQS